MKDRLALTNAINMESEATLGFIEAVLSSVHPSSQGWQQLKGCLLDEIEMDFVFIRKGQPPVAIMVMDSPYVSMDDLKLGDHIRSVYRSKMNGRELNVVLVYKELLMRPQRIPNGVSVLSVTEDVVKEVPILAN